MPPILIIWGTDVSADSLGVVADECPACGDVRAFELVRHSARGHVYFVSTGSAERVGETMLCLTCQNSFLTSRKRYQSPMRGDVQDLTQLLKRTNPRLHERVERGDRLHAAAERGDPEARITIAIESLKPFARRDEQAAAWIELLNLARAKAGPDVDALLRDVAAWEERRHEEDDRIGFLVGMSEGFPSLAGIGTGASVFLVGGTGAAVLESILGWVWAAGVLTASVALGVLAYARVRRFREARWFRRTFFPAMEQLGFRLEETVETMHRLDPSLGPSVRHMLDAARRLPELQPQTEQPKNRPTD